MLPNPSAEARPNSPRALAALLVHLPLFRSMTLSATRRSSASIRAKVNSATTTAFFPQFDVDAAARCGHDVDGVDPGTRAHDEREIAGIEHRRSHRSGPHYSTCAPLERTASTRLLSFDGH